MDTIIGDTMHCIEVHKINLSDMPSDINLLDESVMSKVDELVDPAITSYISKYGLPRSSRGWKLLENYSNLESEVSIDDIKDEQSVYTVKVFLDSEFSGGQINFIHRDLVVDITPGDVLIYPSSYINAYTIMPILSGTQKYLANKYRFPDTPEG